MPRLSHEMKIYGQIKLYAGTASTHLAHEIAQYLGLKTCTHDVILFPNDNLFVKLHSSVRGQDVYIIQTTSAPVQYNLMELLITLQTLNLDSAARITAVIPYLAYARSDKKDQPRVPITARLVADMIEIAGADRYMTIDPHAGQIQGFFSIPGDVLTAFHLLVEHVTAHLLPKLNEPVVLSADLGFAKKARNFAERINAPIAFIEKKRSGNDAKAKAMNIIGEVDGRDVIIVDDEVDTGGSISEAVMTAKSRGADKIYLVFTHAVLSKDAAERLAALPIEGIITTDTIPIPPEKMQPLQGKVTVVSVAPLLAEVILRAHEGRSVGEMFNE